METLFLAELSRSNGIGKAGVWWRAVVDVSRHGVGARNDRWNRVRKTSAYVEYEAGSWSMETLRYDLRHAVRGDAQAKGDDGDHPADARTRDWRQHRRVLRGAHGLDQTTAVSAARFAGDGVGEARSRRRDEEFRVASRLPRLGTPRDVVRGDGRDDGSHCRPHRRRRSGESVRGGGVGAVFRGVRVLGRYMAGPSRQPITRLAVVSSSWGTRSGGSASAAIRAS